MIRTFSALTIAALSVALTGPSATAQSNESSSAFRTFENTNFEFQLDIGSVIAAGSNRDVDQKLLFDMQAGFEIETLTDAGRRWGVVATARVERDSGRRAWGGRIGDCPQEQSVCASHFDGVSSRPILAPVSGLFTVGPDRSDGTRLALEAGYAYVHTGWGEFRFGYGSGAADTDTESGPSAFRLTRADGGRVDLTGLSYARTRNLTSGFSPKLVFRSIQLGQVSSIGVGRVSVSYTPEVRDCGVDFCAREYGPSGLLSPLSDSVWEVSARYEVHREEHEIAISIGFSDSEDATGRSGFEGVEVQNIGISWANGPWSAGANWLRSNNGISWQNGYQAWSVSTGYEKGPWITVLEYAQFQDDLVHAEGGTTQISASRLMGDRWILGGGLQWADLDEPVLIGSNRVTLNRDASSAFFELGWQF